MENGDAIVWKNNLQLCGKSSCKKQILAKLPLALNICVQDITRALQTAGNEYINNLFENVSLAVDRLSRPCQF